MSDRPIVLGFLGIHAGGRPSQPVSQNETVAALFRKAGYLVQQSSKVRRPVWRTLHHVWSLLTWKDVDLIVVAVFSGPSFWIADYASLLARRIRPKKVVLFLHGGHLAEFERTHPARVARAFDRADRILAPSDFLADSFRARGYEVGVIPNVLRTDRYQYTPRHRARPALLWMRTFDEIYDPCLAVDVLAQVAENHPEVTLTMGGADHGALAETRARATEMGVADRVTFAGYLDTRSKLRAFADHDLFLNTNRIDNMPVSVLEAAASGLVPVATAVGGIPSLLTDGSDSLLVPAGDATAMGQAVCGLLDDPARFAALSRGARDLAEQSGWAAVRPQWEAEFGRLLPDRSLR